MHLIKYLAGWLLIIALLSFGSFGLAWVKDNVTFGPTIAITSFVLVWSTIAGLFLYKVFQKRKALLEFGDGLRDVITGKFNRLFYGLLVSIVAILYCFYEAIVNDNGDLLTYSIGIIGGILVGFHSGAVWTIEALHFKIYGNDKSVDVDAVLDDLL